MASINLFLFGKPEWEFEGKISVKGLKSKGNELKSRLHDIADAVQKLLAENWECELTLYGLLLYKDISKAKAQKELDRLGIKDASLLEDEEC